MSSFLITLAIAVCTGAALYYFLMNLQRTNQRVDALALHMRKLEGLVWAYNIRGHQSAHDDSEHPVSDYDEEEEHHYSNPEESYEEEGREFHPAEADIIQNHLMKEGGASSIILETFNVPIYAEGRVEEIPDEDAPLPNVVSFDAFNSAVVHDENQVVSEQPEQDEERPEQGEERPEQDEEQQERQEQDDEQQERQEQDEEQQEQAEERQEQERQEQDDEQQEHQPGEQDEENLSEEQKVEQQNKCDVKDGVKVYADNYANRKLGRVGLPKQ